MVCCCSLAGTAACQHCRNNPFATDVWTNEVITDNKLDAIPITYDKLGVTPVTYHKEEKQLGCDTYSVLYNDVALASGMSLEDAMIFVEALFKKYWNEPNQKYSIEKETERDD